MTEKLYGVDEAAAYCGIAKSTLYNYRCQGKFPDGQRDGRRVVYSAADLDGWKSARAAPKPKRARKKATAEQPAASI